MSDRHADFAVIGSSPTARLLAGLLAANHARTVVHVGVSQSAYRLPRSIDLSIAPITRPESWALLAEGISETSRLLGRIAGRRAIGRIDPVFFAEGPRASEALAHMRQMAMAFGRAAEPGAPSLLGTHRSGVVFRDAILVNRPHLEPALDFWLERAGVGRLVPDRLAIADDGSALIEIGSEVLSARQTILADHDSILAHLPPARWPTLFRRHAGATILTTPTQPLAAPVMLEINSGIQLVQQAEGGIAAIGTRDMAAFADRVQALLGHQRQVEQAGQVTYVGLSTSDGAPAVGRIAGSGADIVAGFGGFGLFVVPALARWLCGEAHAVEADWFGERLVTRSGPSAVADFMPDFGSATT